MKKTIIIIFVLAIGAGIYYYSNNRQKENSNAKTPILSEQVNTSPLPTDNTSAKTYSMEEVIKHGPASWGEENVDPQYSTCWMVIHDKVYEVPDSFAETHPGGHAIYEGCGTDATTLFETRPMGTGKPHSENARSLLEKYYIGDLKK